MTSRVIAIDGPAGSGKSTTAKAVAIRLDIPHVESGALYRAVTLAALDADVPFEGQRLVVILPIRYDHCLAKRLRLDAEYHHLAAHIRGRKDGLATERVRVLTRFVPDEDEPTNYSHRGQAFA